MTETQSEAPATCERHGAYTAVTRTTYICDVALPPFTNSCPGCEEERFTRLKLEEQEDANRRRRERIAVRRKAAAIPIRFAGASFDNYTVAGQGQRHAKAVALSFAENFDDVCRSGNSLTFCGKPGTGKTHLAIAVINYLLETERSAIYATVSQLIRNIRDTWRRDSSESESDVVRKYQKADLLVLDEIGVSLGGEAERNQLFDVLDGRYRERKPILAVSNLSGAAMKNRLGERVFDRLTETGNQVVLFSWPSYRQTGMREMKAGDSR